MQIRVEFTREPIVRPAPSSTSGTEGAWVEFAGRVRAKENGRLISALEYEAYDSMALRLMRELLQELGVALNCTTAQVIHRLGVVPVGEIAIWMGVGSVHRHEALALLAQFMDRLKQDVPIWKRRALPATDLMELPS